MSEAAGGRLWYAGRRLPGIDVGQFFIGFVVLLFSLTVHEAAHAWSADRLGDQTARLMGRVSLNPMVHADLFGTVLFPLVSMSTGVPLIGWAKPVPVNTLNLRDRWREKYMLIAAAGPASNLILAAAGAVLFKVMVASLDGAAVSADGPSVALPLVNMLAQLVYINVTLAVFNMIPVPPLDGGNVLAGLVPPRFAEALDRIRPYGFVVLYGLVLSGVLSTVVGPIRIVVLRWLV